MTIDSSVGIWHKDFEFILRGSERLYVCEREEVLNFDVFISAVFRQGLTVRAIPYLTEQLARVTAEVTTAELSVNSAVLIAEGFKAEAEALQA